MRKVLKIVGAVLGAAVLAVVGLGVWAYRQSLEPRVDYYSRLHGRDIWILCEWHYPATNGAPAYVEVCYATGLSIQCYRIEGDRVKNYHHFRKCHPSDTQGWTLSEQGSKLSRAMRNVWDPSQTRGWYWELVESRDRVSGERFDFSLPEGKAFSDIISDMESQIRLYETNHVGYVSMTTWVLPRRTWEAAAYPFDEAPPEFKALRDVFEQCMADPSEREYHTSYVRGYPVPTPEKPSRTPVFDAWRYGFKQRDVVQFLPSMGRVLVPIEKGVNPFRKFRVPYAPGNSLVVNYRNENEDTVLFLHGDNFWRIQVYGGEESAQ